MELARRQMVTLLTTGTWESLKPSPRPVQRRPRVHVDPRVLREVAPPILPAPAPSPQPERPVRELPNAPAPKPNDISPDPQPSAPTPKTEAPKPALKLEAPDTPQPQHGLILPKNSTTRSLQDTIHEAATTPSARHLSGAPVCPIPRPRASPPG